MAPTSTPMDWYGSAMKMVNKWTCEGLMKKVSFNIFLLKNTVEAYM